MISLQYSVALLHRINKTVKLAKELRDRNIPKEKWFEVATKMKEYNYDLYHLDKVLKEFEK